MGVKKLNAEQIIQNSGSKLDIQLIRARELVEHKKIQAQLAMKKKNSNEAFNVQNYNDMIRAKIDQANEKPKEKLQSQLDTIVPMEIVRA